MASTIEELESLVLSAVEIKSLTGWPEAMIEDYLTILRNVVLTATNIDVNTDQIAQNAADIVDLQNDKTNKIDPATDGNIVSMDATGDIEDSGISKDAVQLQIAAPVNENLVQMDANGFVENSGIAASDVGDNSTNITQLQSDVTDLQNDKANKVSGTPTNEIATLTASGDLQSSGDLIADLLCLDNAGSPEGVVTANKSRLCVDTTGNQIYFNPVVGNNTGWVAV